ncbi:MAG: putative mannose-6-phosphate isomerase YvyI [Lentisphaerae bacterium ADurb.BinA184]|nr:MAG: putative mannose-6-phosphate isomerase YvyI [Lentisphaerae bacterium ADurb.BinA184]
MADRLHPLFFQPVCRQQPWAGGRLAAFLGEDSSARPDTGEWWQLIDDGETQSVVAAGPLRGVTLRELVRSHTTDLIGRRSSPSAPFPLCARLLDTAADQPLSVHPAGDRRTDAGVVRTNTRFWYLLQAAPGATVTVGIASSVTGQQVLTMLDEPGLPRLLHQTPARPGDAYLIPAGIVHSIGAGNLVWELAECNVPPCRLRTADGRGAVPPEERDMAVRALLLESRQSLRIQRETSAATHTRRIVLTPNCPHFMVDEIRLFDYISLRTTGESFHLLTVVAGTVAIKWREGALELAAGDLCCVPASLGEYRVAIVNGPAELLRVTRPFVP